MENIKEKIEDLIAIVEKAGEALLKLYGLQRIAVESKADATPVTEADKLSNEMLRRDLKALTPDIPIISEESAIPDYHSRRKWEYLWLVDPLDGTKEFIYKNGRFCINIALVCKGEPVFGLIYNIPDREIIWAFKGGKSYIRKNGVISLLKAQNTLGPKLRVAVSRFNITEAEFIYLDFLQEQGFNLELIPIGASVKHCEIAKGLIDVYPKFGRCYEWDSAAGQVIVENMGGLVVNPIDYSDIRYNKESMVNPPFIMFSRKITEQIEDGNESYIHYE